MNTSRNDNALLTAVSDGQIDQVHKLLSDAGADVNLQSSFGFSALHLASLNGYVDIVKLLLKKGAQIESRDINGCTPLWIAAAVGQIGVVDVLVERGAYIDAISYKRHLPLNAAILNGHTDVALKLIKLSNVMIPIYQDSMMLFMNEVFKGHENQILLLVKQLRTHGTQGFMKEIWSLMKPFAELLLRPTGDSLPVEVTTAAENFDQHVIQALFDCFVSSFNGSDFADASIKAFHAEYERNFYNVSIANADIYSGLAIDLVTLVSVFTELVLTLRHFNSNDALGLPNASLDSRCNKAMHYARTLEAMRSLLQNGADVEAENADGLRPIHCAVRTNKTELVYQMIQRKANVDATDVFGNTPLHEAVCYGLDIVQLLVQHEAKLNVQNIDGKTPLHIAVERQQPDAIMFLLSQKDIDVGVTDVWRNTPFHYVSKRMGEKKLKNIWKNISIRSISIYTSIHTKHRGRVCTRAYCSTCDKFVSESRGVVRKTNIRGFPRKHIITSCSWSVQKTE